ncbi:NAD(P)H azoreductase [Paraburkholderia kirstenboschensis]|uniref:SDR family oxidoreductase n=1 Tax=Paraburkholderia kirstenboschensis TaxID=1245436 RepID=UPI000B0A9129|nr:NmrA family NAD(P)-binding protein [Paraburkholderia kirstenboschensis]CAD6534941.1 NAD(P)H azoreductase [Paraburkholderia kirstenboschensis]
MSILVTGASGTVGMQIVQRLASRGVEVKALVRAPGKTALPSGVTEVVGDMSSASSMRAALSSVRTLFLLNAVVPDEVTQALVTLNLARDAGIERIVYLSVIHADLYTNVPHFTGKHTVERMIESLEMPATILRPAYFIQNDERIKSVVESYGIYPMPIGQAGVNMVDVRDIADVAAAELLARHRAPNALPGRTLDVVGPEALTGESVARIWSEALQREIRYAGDDLDGFEQQLAAHGPDWLAYDMRLMMAGIQSHGMRPGDDAVNVLTKMLGRPLRTYRDAVHEMLGLSQ